ncbi:MAG: nucleotide exchange factor GrpE [Gammaproteobacteria bacterium]
MSDEKENNSTVQEDVIEALEGPEENLDTTAEESEQASVSAELLAAQLEDARKEARANWEKLLRTQAELENLRRRTQRELQEAHKYALEKFGRELLPVLDSLELGIEAASSGGSGGDIVKLREGGELTLQQFKSVLEKFNFEIVDPLGKPFNPEFHQAMAMEPSAEVEANTVIRVFQKGYLLNQRLLRPAMVVVAQAAKPVKIDEQA